MIRSHSALEIVALALAAAACSGPPPRPPGGALAFPTGLGVTADRGAILVVTSNFDRTFDNGEVLRVPASLFGPAATDVVLDPSALTGRVQIGSFGGNLATSLDGKRAYVSSREDAALAVIDLTTAGLVCLDGTGDCRASAVPVPLGDPLGVSVVRTRLPGDSAPGELVLVAQSSPTFLGTDSNGAVIQSASIAAIGPAGSTVAAGTPAGTVRYVAPIGTVGSGPPLFDEARGVAYVPGCYTRVSATLVRRCDGSNNAGTNLLRVLDPSAGAAGYVGSVDLFNLLRGTEVAAVALSSDGATLYAATRSPNALVELQLPLPLSGTPSVRRVTDLPADPSALLVLPRAGQPDLVAVSAVGQATVSIFDGRSGTVAATVERVGEQPDAMVRLDAPGGAGPARLVVAAFSDCALTEVDVPLDAPWKASRGVRLVSGHVGACGL